VLGILIDEGVKLEGGGGYLPLASPQVTSVDLRVKYKIIYIATSFVYITSVYCEISKSEVVSVHNIKAYRGRRGIAPLILTLGARWW